MKTVALLAIDQGTSSSRAIAFSLQGEILESVQIPFEQIYPNSGWVEHDPEVLWATVLSATRSVLERLRAREVPVASIGVTNQRETTIAWNRRTGVPLYNAIVWQDRRTAEFCRELERAGHEPGLTAKTGLRLDPYFSATKMAWILGNVPDARAAAARGELAFGTVDSFLIWRLTAGRRHVTDATNASRTALFDVVRNRWDPELCTTFGIPENALPLVLDCTDNFGETDPGILGASFPIRGVAGDQQSALVGQAGFSQGDVKSTYGTGAFLMLNTGEKLVESRSRLLGTIAYRMNGRTTYALEGSILSAGATIQWLRDGLGLFTAAGEVEALAGSVSDTGGVYLVPAFTGLGAPYWDPDARGAIVGLTRASERAQIVRAALDSVVYQTRDLLDAMAADGVAPGLLKVDGGMARNALFLQRLADVLAIPIRRPKLAEATAWGAACLAGLGCGVFSSIEDIARLWSAEADFQPHLDARVREVQIKGWHRALQRVGPIDAAGQNVRQTTD